MPLITDSPGLSWEVATSVVGSIEKRKGIKKKEERRKEEKGNEEMKGDLRKKMRAGEGRIGEQWLKVF